MSKAIQEANRSAAITRKVGDSVKLECALPPAWTGTSIDLPTYWYYLDPKPSSDLHSKGSLIQPEVGGRLKVTSNSSLRQSCLVIDSLQLADSGLYLCDQHVAAITAFNVIVTGLSPWLPTGFFFQKKKKIRIDTEVRCVGACPPFWPLEPARVKPN